MVIPRPKDVEMLVSQVGKGELVTPAWFPKRLAQDYEAAVARLFTTDIFLWMVANATFESIQMQRATQAAVVSCWRVVNNDGFLYPKFLEGVAI